MLFTEHDQKLMKLLYDILFKGLVITLFFLLFILKRILSIYLFTIYFFSLTHAHSIPNFTFIMMIINYNINIF